MVKLVILVTVMVNMVVEVVTFMFVGGTMMVAVTTIVPMVLVATNDTNGNMSRWAVEVAILMLAKV